MHIKKVVMSLFLAVTVAASASADEIVIGADIWPPFNGEPGSAAPGYMVEVAQKVFGAKGHTIVYKEIPWSRAIKNCRAGKIAGVFGAGVGDAEDFVFPKESLGILENHFFTLKNSTWKYDGIESLKKVKVGIIKDYEYGEEMDKYFAETKGKMVQFVGGDSPLESNIKKLKAGRIDVVIEGKPVFEYTAKEMGMVDLFKTVGGDNDPDPIYIAFSPKNPKSKEYAAILSAGIVELRKSGELSKILAKYGQKDWK